MDTKFTLTFFLVTLVLEIIPIRKVMNQANTYRSTDWSKIDDTVTATLLKSGSYRDEKTGWEYWGKYEWYYNGKRRRKTLYDTTGHFPYHLQITVNRRTGRFKTPEGERRVNRMNVSLVVGAFLLGYIITCIIMGYSPLLS